MRSTEECEMSRSCHSATSSSAGVTAERTMRASPVRFSARTGLRLCGMAEEPFWPFGEEFLRFHHFGALQMADLGRQPLDRRRDDAERGKESRVAVARDHLGRDRLRLQVQFRRHISSRPAGRCWRKCRPRRKSRRSKSPRAPRQAGRERATNSA